MGSQFVQLLFLLGLGLSSSVGFANDDWFGPDEVPQQAQVSQVKNLRGHLHYTCSSEQRADVTDGFAQMVPGTEARARNSRFDLIFSETYDIPLRMQYGSIENGDFKKWFLLFGQFDRPVAGGGFERELLDLHSLIHVPEAVSDYQAEYPEGRELLFQVQAGTTNLWDPRPWRTRVRNPLVYAGSTLPSIGQLTQLLLSTSGEALGRIKSTHVVLQAPLTFARQGAQPQEFFADLRVAVSTGPLPTQLSTVIFEIRCVKQSDDMDEGDLRQVLTRSKTFTIDEHFTETWGIPKGAVSVHRVQDPVIPASPVSWALEVARLLQEPHVRVSDYRLWSWQTAAVIGGSLGSLLLFRGAAQGARANSVVPALYWRGYRVSTHETHSLEEALALAEQLAPLSESQAQALLKETPATLVDYLLLIGEEVDQQMQHDWYSEHCADSSQCS